MTYHKLTGRHRVPLIDGLRAKPLVNASGSLAPMCHLCTRDVSSEAIVEVGPDYAVVLVRHHGAEETYRFEMGRRCLWDSPDDPHAWEDLNRLMRGRKWFDPAQFMGQAPAKPDDGLDFAYEK